MKKQLLVMAGAGILVLCAARAGEILIENAGLEDNPIENPHNVSFDGIHGGSGEVPGWSSNEPSFGGAIRVDEHYPGRTGNNVMYLHGSGAQNFHTEGYDLGVNLESDTTYVLMFDVLRWQGVTTEDTVVFSAGLYTGADYENRVPLREFQGQLMLVDHNNNPVNKVTVVLVYTTGKVEPGTRFWIGGDAFGNADDASRAHFDNFRLFTETR